MNRTHGMTGTPEYEAWRQMIQRCTNPDHINYRNYGARGITVYEGWLQAPQPFIDYVGPRPSPQHSIDREDNSKGYEPGNVRWATPAEQALNRRSKSDSCVPGVKIYAATGLWSAITPCHPQTKKFKWLGRKFQTQDEAIQVRADWLEINWPEYPQGKPLTEW